MGLNNIDKSILDSFKVRVTPQDEIDAFIADQKKSKIASNIHDLAFPKAWELKNFDYDCWPGGVDAVNTWLKTRNDNLFLCEKTGRGKTRLACSAARKKAEQGKRVFRVNEVYLNNEWKFANNRVNEVYNSMIRNSISCDVLIFEELGKNDLTIDKNGIKLTPFGKAVYTIFDQRYEFDKQTIVTTQHMSINEITESIGDSIYRRVLRESRGYGNKCIVARSFDPVVK